LNGAVFVVDDDAEIRAALRIALETDGFHVDAFDSAVRFLPSWGRGFPHVGRGHVHKSADIPNRGKDLIGRQLMNKN
jgi:CheY-like chemotaxis protein